MAMGTIAKKSGMTQYISVYRLVSSCVVILIVGVAVMAGSWRAAQIFGNTYLHAAAASQTHQVVVATGDTLWEVAVKFGPQGQDPRKTVSEIRRINQLHSSNLYPGMVLRVPVEADVR